MATYSPVPLLVLDPEQTNLMLDCLVWSEIVVELVPLEIVVPLLMIHP